VLLDTRFIGRNTPIDPAQPIDGTKNRSILGGEQYAWLQGQLQASRSRWRVIMSQVLVAPFRVFGQPAMTNAWEGYPEDRDRFLRLFTNGNVHNNVVVSGDAHMSFAANLSVDGRNAAVELLPTSISRGTSTRR
jgi:alkaline phosphatase D